MITSLVSAGPEAPKSNVRFLVTDNEGGAIQDAKIFLHWDPSGNMLGLTKDFNTELNLPPATDNKGTSNTNLEPGFYDVFVTAAAFTPSCKKIRVKPEQPISETFRLEANSLVTAELGHKIYSSPDRKQ